MSNYLVFENRKTKERVIVKEIDDKRLKLYRLQNNIPVVKNIDWSELRQIRRELTLRYVGKFKSMSMVPAPICFGADYI